jgi:hypothetical protein
VDFGTQALQLVGMQQQHQLLPGSVHHFFATSQWNVENILGRLRLEDPMDFSTWIQSGLVLCS